MKPTLVNYRLRQTGTQSKQRGFTIVSAIFLLVVLASLGAFIVNISTTQSITSAQDLQGSRAFHAARAGLEWGLYQVLDPLNTTVVAPGSVTWPNMPECPADTSMIIEGFSVSVRCVRFPSGAAGPSGPPVYNESGASRSIVAYELTATASSGAVGSMGFVERSVSATVNKCRAADGAAPMYECW
jgi:MSHA biogenesis protein MshP